MEIKSQKSKTDSPANDAAARTPDLKDILNVDPLQQGQALLAASKKRKKQQKRAGLYEYQPQSSVVHHFIIVQSVISFNTLYCHQCHLVYSVFIGKNLKKEIVLRTFQDLVASPIHSGDLVL